MKKIGIALVALMILFITTVMADSGFVNINGLTGSFSEQYIVKGGCYDDLGVWKLQDFQHPTAIVTTNAQTTGIMGYQNSWTGSGTEASGRAWKYDSSSIFSASSGNIDTTIDAWNVNQVPPAGGFTQINYQEITNDIVGFVHGLSVNGFATNYVPLIPPTVFDHYASIDSFTQFRTIDIN